LNKQIAIELNDAVEVVCKRFSRTDREMNFNQETFEVDEIIPTSDHTAVVKFKKQPTGKIGIAFFYYIQKGMSKGWKYFFPTDSHIAGMRGLELVKFEIERHNYQYNFVEHG
jgi:hypothetical protein